jgi:formylglycine-generating enzyme required for sulfatase activity
MATAPPRPRSETASVRTDLIALGGGTFWKGSDEDRYPQDGESPPRMAHVDDFRIAAHTVTNADFARFVAATGYGTTAEREGWSFVFAGLLPDAFPPTRAVVGAPWWRQVHGATWLHPEGPASDLDGRSTHPVVHVSWIDAREFCRWAGGRLPSESEWEYAARGGLERRRYPWGDELTPGGEHRMNVFQGRFPETDTGEDGFAGTAPVGAFPPNGYGLYNATGNVWEWTADRFGPGRPGQRVTRGGSYLCHDSYCWRYRCAARSGNTPDSSAGNIGFRMAANAVS